VGIKDKELLIQVALMILKQVYEDDQNEFINKCIEIVTESKEEID
jgi:hypothetical protein